MVVVVLSFEVIRCMCGAVCTWQGLKAEPSFSNGTKMGPAGGSADRRAGGAKKLNVAFSLFQELFQVSSTRRMMVKY